MNRIESKPASTLRVLWLAALMLVIATPAIAATGQDFAHQAGDKIIGRQAPSLQLTTIDGQHIDLAKLYGHKAVYLKFWATWCTPCRKQMPHFEAAQRGAGDDLAVIAINLGLDDTPEQIDAVRREFGLTMPIVRDDGNLAVAFGVRVTPQHVIIDRSGRIAYVGHEADAGLDAALALARKPAPAGAAVAARATNPQSGTDAAGIADLDGRALSLGDPAHKRDTTLVFLTPWCEGYFAKTRPQASAQCKLVREQLQHTGADAPPRWIVIASGVWTSEDDLRAYRDEHAIKLPLVLDRGGALFHRYGVDHVPALVVLDADGQVARRIDSVDKAALDAVARKR
jgi:peroxiredoxin